MPDDVPWGVRLLESCCPQSRTKRMTVYKMSILAITFLSYMSYHLSRKPITIVKDGKVGDILYRK